MRLCRFEHDGMIHCGLFTEDAVLPLGDVAAVAGEKYLAELVHGGELERLLPVDSPAWHVLGDLVQALENESAAWQTSWLPRDEVRLLPPIARPAKLLLLAGNYAAHVREQGETSAERERTFPYVFMKPASTTLVGDRSQVQIPAISPDKIDHEVELAVILGRRGKNISVDEASEYIAGYTVINDLSDRGYRPNPERMERPRDKFFDWLHGKWHDGFCPCGPCLVTSDEIEDPQRLQLSLQVDGELRQSGSTADQVFSVDEVIEFISRTVTLEPGDIISTGTPAGVGNASGRYLQHGSMTVAAIENIGKLTTYLVAQ